VPRDIHPEVETIENVFLYTVDDLRGVVQANLGRRKNEIVHVENIIKEVSEDFNKWYSKIEAIPIIQKLKNKLDGIRSMTLVKYAKNEINEKPEKNVNMELIDRVTDKIIGKIVKEILSGFEDCKSDKDWNEYSKNINEVFGI
jgi:glutamyl-tRNA reductase